MMEMMVSALVRTTAKEGPDAAGPACGLPSGAWTGPRLDRGCAPREYVTMSEAAAGGGDFRGRGDPSLHCRARGCGHPRGFSSPIFAAGQYDDGHRPAAMSARPR